MKYFAMTMERGHVGTKNFDCHITFYIAADSMVHAMNIAKKMPGVKHSRMPFGREISYAEFAAHKGENAYETCGAKMALKGKKI